MNTEENIAENNELETVDKKPSNKFETVLKEWIIPFAIEIGVILLIVRYVFFMVIVPTGSMLPTVDEHSLLFTLRVHNPEKLERGDIVVFESEELGENLVKRLIGLPGEYIVIDGKDVYVDGEKLDEPYVVYESTEGYYEFLLDEDEYLFLGDNRAGSYDARYWNNPYIKGDAIMGKSIFTIYPFSNFGILK